MTREDKAAYNYARERLDNDDYPVYSHEYELELAFKAGIEYAKQWISVEDELPPTSDKDDESDDYLIIDSYGDNDVGYYNKMDGLWFSCDGYILYVTHWMPIPPLPSASEKPTNCTKKKGGEQ